MVWNSSQKVAEVPKNWKKVNKNSKNLTFKNQNNKPSQGFALRNICITLGVVRKTFRYRTDGFTHKVVTERQNHRHISFQSVLMPRQSSDSQRLNIEKLLHVYKR